MRKFKLLIFLNLFYFSTQASALMTGNKLYEYCQSNESSFVGYCMGYIQAASEVAPNYANAVGGTSDICIPPEVSTTQMVEIFKKRMRDSPESRHKPASLLVVAALSVVFPCTK